MIYTVELKVMFSVQCGETIFWGKNYFKFFYADPDPKSF